MRLAPEMENVPKVVLERLKASAPVVNHPDADVLTAFSEQSLPDREREQVVEHLARCGDCREILTLALPETDLDQIVAGSAVGGWFRWPTLRWGFVTAGVVIAALGVLQYQRRSHISTFMAERSAAPTIAARDESRSGAALPEAAAERKKLEKAVAPVSSSESPTNDVSNVTPNGLAAAPMPKSPAQAEMPVVRTPARGSAVSGQNLAALPHGPRMNQSQINQNQTSQQQVTLALESPPYPPAVGGQSMGTRFRLRLRRQSRKPRQLLQAVTLANCSRCRISASISNRRMAVLPRAPWTKQGPMASWSATDPRF